MTRLQTLRPALTRLDAALAHEILRLRARYQLSLDEFRGLYVSDEQVDALLSQAGMPPPTPAELPPLQASSQLAALIALFGLCDVAADLLLLALAPDCDPKYATILAYLNDDVQRRWPTVDLARRLFGASDELSAALDPAGPLFGTGLLVPAAAGEARGAFSLVDFAPNPVVSAHLLGAAVRLPPGVAMLHPASEQAGRLDDVAAMLAAGGRPIAVLTGRKMAGRSEAVLGLAGRLRCPVVRLNLGSDASPLTSLRDAGLAARLAGALLLIDPGPAGLAPVASALRDLPVPVFVLAEEGEPWRPALAGCVALEVPFPPLGRDESRRRWAGALQRAGLMSEAAAQQDVADRFRLSARQIQAAVESLRLKCRLVPGQRGSVGAASLQAAARDQASSGLSALAQPVAPRHGWADLALPLSCQRQLRQLAGAIRHRARVFGEWGFGGSAGLIVLFSGGPGTGKSMSAGVLAREAGLDLWRIDLSTVVSKYIGETEKHLERVFTLARDGNAILFFDEADALFGKRSEVKDAHDRYANIEVAFLLQRLEAYDGVAILATNMARNVDRAFSRRMHFVIEFPQPDATLRERLWRQALPPEAPVAPDIDFGFLAHQFAFAGGDIRVAALDAAFAAAAADAPIGMTLLLQAVSRQLLKQGKVPQASDFRQYHGLVAEPDESTLRAVASA